MPFTPGPWSVMPTPADSHHTHKIMYDCVQDHRRIGAVCGVFAKEDGEADANARLLAAAPDLLRCVKTLLQVSISPASCHQTAADLVRMIEGGNLWEGSTGGLTRQ